MDDNLDLGKDSDIQRALRQFETEHKDQSALVPENKKEKGSRMIGWAIQHSGGLIKDERQAEYVLLIFALIAIVLAGYSFAQSQPDTEPPPQSVIDQAGGPGDFFE